MYKNIFSQLNKENKNFKISCIEKGKSNRDYFNAYEWLELAHVIYRCHNIKGHVNLPLQEESSGLFRLYLADEGIFTYQSQVNQSDFFVKERRNTLAGVFYGNCTAIKISSNNFGYNKENDILTIPHYAVFALAKNIRNIN
ncbi:MAG: hypothetical protein IJ688_08670 [Treponema sp.]|nr:hypothetical protein [Treponema sp.]